MATKLTVSLAINPALLALLAEGRGQEGGPYRQAATRGLARAVEFWHRNYLPLHFTPQAPGRYSGAYTPRARGYSIRKARRGAAGRPMVFTGRMRGTLLTPGGYSIKRPSQTSRKIEVTATLPFARAVNLWSGQRLSKASGQRHDFRRELTVMREDEIAALVALVETEIRESIEQDLSEGERALAAAEIRGRFSAADSARFFGVFGGGNFGGARRGRLAI